MPTQITKINNTYYIVDCKHNQIIYSDSLSRELRCWNVMTRNVKEPHALCSDGDIYMVADTENNRVLTFTKGYDSFKLQQTFENVGRRPHYTYYDAVDKLFYAWSSMTGEMYIYQRIGTSTSLELLEIKSVPELKNQTFGLNSYLRLSPYSKLGLQYHGINEYRRGGNKLNLPPHEANVTEQVEHNIQGGGLTYNFYSPNEKNRLTAYFSFQSTSRKSYYGGIGEGTDEDKEAAAKASLV